LVLYKIIAANLTKEAQTEKRRKKIDQGIWNADQQAFLPGLKICNRIPTLTMALTTAYFQPR